MALTDKLTAIANAIRGKTGKTDALTLDQMPAEIEGIEAGGADYLVQRVSNTLTSWENDSVTSIGKNAFADCTSLRYISCPNVTTINANAFYGANNLETALFPNVVSFPNNGVFRGCRKLKEFIAPKMNTSRFDAEIFSGCAAITKIDIGSIVVITGYGVFMDCSALETLILRKADSIVDLASTTAFNNSAIANGTGYIYVPAALVGTYKSATNWTVYADQFRAIEHYPEICGEVSA